jgi:hypothetical protein
MTWTPDFYYYIPTYRRQALLLRTLGIIGSLAAVYGVKVEVVAVDATEQPIPDNDLPASSAFFRATVIHSPKTPVYRAGHVLKDKIDPNIPVFYGADDEIGFIDRADLNDFAAADAAVGVPPYLMVKAEHEDYLQSYIGWTQCRDLCLIADPLTRLKLFADQGVILHYALFNGKFFQEHFQFISEIIDILDEMEPELERFCETVFSLTTMLVSNKVLQSSGYLRRVDRRPAQIKKARLRWDEKPVYPWIQVPRLRNEHPGLFCDVVSVISNHWSQLVGGIFEESQVNIALDQYARGYQLANSRTWREGYEFIMGKPGVFKDNPSAFARFHSNSDSDYFSYVLNPGLVMSEIEQIKFRSSWVSHPMLRSLFIAKSSTLFDDENQFLNID